MPPEYVQPYVKVQKTDDRDAGARGEELSSRIRKPDTSAVVTSDPDAANLLQSGGVHIRPQMSQMC
jgi:hypothetical protein